MRDGLISLHGVRFAYSGNAAAVLQDLDLEIPASSVTAILGPNGVGKTTLLHLILGYRLPQRGSAVIAGRPLPSYSRRELSQLVGLVPQDEQPTFDLRVLEYVLLGRAPHIGALDMPGPDDLAIADAAIASAGVAHLRERAITTLSGGERQLVTIARTLAQEPRIFLLDEPTAHLDLGNRSRVLNILRDLQRRGATVVLTTHDPDAVAAVADYVVLMRSGQPLQAGPPDAVLTEETLNATYGVPVRVLRVDHRLVVFTPLA